MNHPKQYAEWSKIKPIDIEELELATGSTDDLTFDNLTSVLFNSCQHFNYETLREGVVQYYFDSLEDDEREEEMALYEDKDSGDIEVLESAIDFYIKALNEEEKRELFSKLM